MRKVHLAALCAIAGFAALEARAADNGFYFGAAIGKSEVDVEDRFRDFVDDDATVYKVIAGIRPFDWLAFEATYTDLGEVGTTQRIPSTVFVLSDVEIEQRGLGAWGVFLYDFATFDVYAKAGLVHLRSEFAVETNLLGRQSGSEDTAELAWGVGFQARLGSFAARLELERFEVDESFLGTRDPQLISVGVTWTFL